MESTVKEAHDMELEPCPFCGGEAVVRDDETASDGITSVRCVTVLCTSCKAWGPWFNTSARTVQEATELAVQAWNMRKGRQNAS